jgi:ketosteroid isomerase-like protein
MATQDVELITRLYRAWNDGDMAALREVFDAEVEVRPALSTFMASAVYRGHEGVAAWYADTYEPWSELRAEPQRFVHAGERTAVVVGLQARVEGGHVEVDGEVGHVITIRDGMIVRLDGYEEAEEALAAVGALAQEDGS